jgi:hypothetical protein
MVKERADYPVIEWRDFLWNKELLVVRDEVAKQTRARQAKVCAAGSGHG